jgi:(4-O-methyl)-D-glucuronate---lignin esterase
MYLTIVLSSLLIIVAAFLFWMQFGFESRRVKANYRESRAGSPVLPDLLITNSGKRVENPEDWFGIRRPELLEAFRQEIHGTSPRAPGNMSFEVIEEGPSMEEAALRRQVRINFSGKAEDPGMDLLLYLPADSPKPVPVFLLLNFTGNHSVYPDKEIRIAPEIASDHKLYTLLRPRKGGGWSPVIKELIHRGYGIATAFCDGLAPCRDDGFTSGVFPLMDAFPPDERPANAWGAIGAWAWGLSRAMDYLETDPQADSGKVAVLGHSRLGKTALWAGAQDQRFAMVVSTHSGFGGAALSRRKFGETVDSMIKSFPHWYCENFKKYKGDWEALPVDSPSLLSLIAPRPLYISSAVKDGWADPMGEFLGALHTDPVYKLLGTEGLPVKNRPPVDKPVMGRIAYHIRKGGHVLNLYDWIQYMDFADKHFKK